MPRTIIAYIISICTFTTFFGCSDKKIPDVYKHSATDPFQNTMVPSQFIVIDPTQDNTIEGHKGTILIIPKGSLVDAKGNVIKSTVKIELAEAFTLEDMLLSNLTTSTNEKQFQTDGMIYFNASSNGAPVNINPKNPIRIEIPTAERKADMMAYKGIRDENGNMNWVEPKEIDKDLITIDLNSLDFLPPGFQWAVGQGMPYKNYTDASQALTDSLYYALYANQGYYMQFVPTDFHDPLYNQITRVINSKYGEASLLVQEPKSEQMQGNGDSVSSMTGCGIDPTIIKRIKSKQYQNSFIATRAFEARFRVIFSTCNNAVLETYLKNIDKDLYIADSLAALTLEDSVQRAAFVNFSRQRLTKVKAADKHAKMLANYYQQQMAQLHTALEQAQKHWQQALDNANNSAENLFFKYKDLRLKREKYRVETYGFTWSQTGWIGLHKETNCLPTSLKFVSIEEGQNYDRLYTYIFYPTIKSIQRLNTSNNHDFYPGNEKGKNGLMPKDERGIAIAIGYKDNQMSMDMFDLKTNDYICIGMSIGPVSAKKLKSALSRFNPGSIEDKMSRDLALMEAFYIEQQRQSPWAQEHNLTVQLWNIAFPCCAIEADASIPY